MFSPLNNIILYTNTIKVGATRIKELYDTELFLYDLDFTLIYKKTLKSIVIKSAKFSPDGNYIFLKDDDMYEVYISALRDLVFYQSRLANVFQRNTNP